MRFFTKRLAVLTVLLLAVAGVRAAEEYVTLNGIRYRIEHNSNLGSAGFQTTPRKSVESNETDGNAIVVSLENEEKYEGNVVIPQVVAVDTFIYAVKEIEDSAFAYCLDLNSVSIPSSVSIIGRGAFKGCSNLQRFEVEEENKKFSSANGLLLDGNMLLNVSQGLTSVTIPNVVSSVADSAFVGSSIKDLVIEDGVNPLSLDYDFAKTNLETVYIGRNIVCAVGNSPFENSGIKSVDFGNQLTTIGEYMFSDCDNISSLIIPASVTSIGGYAFWSCKNLKSVEIPSSVTSIGNCAFQDCKSLSSVKLPSNMTSIAYGIFSGCSSLSSVEIPSSVTQGIMLFLLVKV